MRTIHLPFTVELKIQNSRAGAVRRRNNDVHSKLFLTAGEPRDNYSPREVNMMSLDVISTSLWLHENPVRRHFYYFIQVRTGSHTPKTTGLFDSVQAKFWQLLSEFSHELTKKWQQCITKDTDMPRYGFKPILGVVLRLNVKARLKRRRFSVSPGNDASFSAKENT